MKKLICITCPIGCHLTVEDENGDMKVTGATCPRGIDYAKQELTNPTRMITSTVRIKNASYNQIPVKTSAPIPKGKIFDVMSELAKISVVSPVNMGDVLKENICDTGIDIIATRSL